MKKALFEELLESVKQAGEIARGSRSASRSFKIDASTVKELRGLTKLSQPDFAALLGVEVSTLRNWEQGRREPTGQSSSAVQRLPPWRAAPRPLSLGLLRGGCGLVRALLPRGRRRL